MMSTSPNPTPPAETKIEKPSSRWYELFRSWMPSISFSSAPSKVQMKPINRELAQKLKIK